MTLNWIKVSNMGEFAQTRGISCRHGICLRQDRADIPCRLQVASSSCPPLSRLGRSHQQFICTSKKKKKK